MPKETVGIWNNDTKQNVDIEKKTETMQVKIGKNGHPTLDNEWAAKSTYDGKTLYFILTVNKEPKHKDYFQSNISDDKLVLVSEDIYLSYIDYLKNASQTAYKLAVSDFKLNGFG